MSLNLTTPREPAPSPLDAYEQPNGVNQKGQEAQLRLIGACLRGRYHWVALLGGLLGVAGALIGWFSSVPLYRSVMTIRVAPSQQTVLHPDAEKGQLPQFDRFVETQVGLIGGQRILEAAVDRLAKDDAWRRTHIDGGSKSSDAAILELGRRLSVVRNNELIYVYVLDPDPRSAMLGAQAIVETYFNIYVESETKSQTDRLTTLGNYRTQYTNDRAATRKQIQDLASKFGTEDLEVLLQARVAEVTSLQGMLRELETSLKLSDATTKPDAVAGLDQMSVAFLAMIDPTLKELLRERDQAANRLSALKSQNMLEQHQEVVGAKAQVDEFEQRIVDRADELRNDPKALELALSQFAANRGNALVPEDPERLRTQIANLRTQLESSRKEMLEYFGASINIKVLQADIQSIDKNIAEVADRIAQLNIESHVDPRIQIYGSADRPLQAFLDPHRKYAALGGIGGMFGGFVLVLAMGLLDRRLRHADEIELRLNLNQILGTLPSLPEDLSDPDQAAMASHAVHHIRTMLQIRVGQSARTPVLAVTSPVAGTGKTSLVLGLGLSFASTGSRTLMIDCDLIGGGLTSRMGSILRRKIGRILVDRGLVTEEQLRCALHDTVRPGTRLGNRLMELGYVGSADLEESLRIQAAPTAGLIDALQGIPLQECVSPSGLPGLWVLPLGDASPQHATGLSPLAVGVLLKEARRHFDTILIDTGPMPGSLEASVVTAQADGVVAIVARGESSRVVGRCLEQLRNVGAPLLGIVFNRAQERDMELRGTTTRISSRSRSRTRPQQAQTSVPTSTDRRMDFGPVARAVATASPSSPGGSRGNAAEVETGSKDGVR